MTGCEVQGDLDRRDLSAQDRTVTRRRGWTWGGAHIRGSMGMGSMGMGGGRSEKERRDDGMGMGTGHGSLPWVPKYCHGGMGLDLWPGPGTGKRE